MLKELDFTQVKVSEMQFSEEAHAIKVAEDKYIALLIPNTDSDIKAVTDENWKRLNSAFGLNTAEDRVARIDDMRFAAAQINSEIKYIKKDSEASDQLLKMKRSISSKMGAVTKLRNKIFKEVESSYNVDFEPHYNYNGIFYVDLNPNPDLIVKSDPDVTIEKVLGITLDNNDENIETKKGNITNESEKTESILPENGLERFDESQVTQQTIINNTEPTPDLAEKLDKILQPPSLEPEWKWIIEQAAVLSNNEEIILANILNWVYNLRTQIIDRVDKDSIIDSINTRIKGIGFDIDNAALKNMTINPRYITDEIMTILEVPQEEKESLLPPTVPEGFDFSFNDEYYTHTPPVYKRNFKPSWRTTFFRILDRVLLVKKY